MFFSQPVPLYSAPCLNMRWRKAKRWVQGPTAVFFCFFSHSLPFYSQAWICFVPLWLSCSFFPPSLAVFRGLKWVKECVPSVPSVVLRLNDSAPEMKLSCPIRGSRFILHWQSCRSTKLLFFFSWTRITVRNEITRKKLKKRVFFLHLGGFFSS